MVCPEGSPYLLRGRIFLYQWQGVQRANGKPPALSVGMFPMDFLAEYGPKGTGGERKAPSAPAGANPLPQWGLTRRLRRELELAVPWGTLLFRLAIRRGAGGERKAPCIASLKDNFAEEIPL